MPHPMKIKILSIGCGHMGRAILKGALDKNMVDHLDVIDPGLSDRPFENSNLVTKPTGDVYDVVLIAIKPQMAADILPAYQSLSRACFVSIMAGQKLNVMENYLGADKSIIRLMPNLPASVGYGATVGVANAHVNATHKQATQNLFEAIGIFEWVADEDLLDAVTALSGSGPAYVFHMVEAMTEAGIAMGLEKNMAYRLAKQTIIGSAHLLNFDKEKDASQLRAAVTSKGGTTEVALKVLMNNEDGLTALMKKAISFAKDRSVELSS